MLPPSAWTTFTDIAAPMEQTAPVIPLDPSRRVHREQQSATDRTDDVTLRRARIDDIRAVSALAELDSAQPVTGDVLLAEADGRLIAALDVRSGRSIADPFTHTAHAVGLLETRARQLRDDRRSRVRRHSDGFAGSLVRAVAGR